MGFVYHVSLVIGFMVIYSSGEVFGTATGVSILENWGSCLQGGVKPVPVPTNVLHARWMLIILAGSLRLYISKGGLHLFWQVYLVNWYLVN